MRHAACGVRRFFIASCQLPTRFSGLPYALNCFWLDQKVPGFWVLVAGCSGFCDVDKQQVTSNEKPGSLLLCVLVSVGVTSNAHHIPHIAHRMPHTVTPLSLPARTLLQILT
jgi:hypothetical protein